MIIANGQTKTLVAFGNVTQEQFHQFMAQMGGAIAKWHQDGKPNSGDY
jgi:hypothetical protein